MIIRESSDQPLEEEYPFVERPSEEFFCPITCALLLQPHLTGCCGKHLSQEAATKIQGEGGACPLCKEPHLSTFFNKHFLRQVNELRVLCHHENRGCGWQGESVADLGGDPGVQWNPPFGRVLRNYEGFVVVLRARNWRSCNCVRGSTQERIIDLRARIVIKVYTREPITRIFVVIVGYPGTWSCFSQCTFARCSGGFRGGVRGVHASPPFHPALAGGVHFHAYTLGLNLCSYSIKTTLAYKSNVRMFYTLT